MSTVRGCPAHLRRRIQADRPPQPSVPTRAHATLTHPSSLPSPALGCSRPQPATPTRGGVTASVRSVPLVSLRIARALGAAAADSPRSPSASPAPRRHLGRVRFRTPAYSQHPTGASGPTLPGSPHVMHADAVHSTTFTVGAAVHRSSVSQPNCCDFSSGPLCLSRAPTPLSLTP